MCILLCIFFKLEEYCNEPLSLFKISYVSINPQTLKLCKAEYSLTLVIMLEILHSFSMIMAFPA